MSGRHEPKQKVTGPSGNWQGWRDSRSKRIAKPRRNKAAQKLTQPKKDPEVSR